MKKRLYVTLRYIKLRIRNYLSRHPEAYVCADR